MKKTLMILGIICPIFLIIGIIIVVTTYKHEEKQIIFNDTFEMDGKVYRFDDIFLKKKEYELLRNNFVGNKSYKQLDIFTQPDFIINKNTFEVVDWHTDLHNRIMSM